MSRKELQEVSSRVYPGLERVPGKQNWVDKTGGLPSYIERIAKHLHYEKGRTIGAAIATAVETTRRWCSTGKNWNGGDLKPATQAKACKAVASWEAKKAKSKSKTAAKKLKESAEIQEARQIIEANSALPCDDAVAKEIAGLVSKRLFIAEGMLPALKEPKTVGKQGLVRSAVDLLESDLSDKTVKLGLLGGPAADPRDMKAVADLMEAEVEELRALAESLGVDVEYPKPKPKAKPKPKSKKRGSRRRGGKPKPKEIAEGGGMWLQSGDKGAAVKEVQQQVDSMGAFIGDAGADGKFGYETERGVKAIQRREGLKMDGVVGPKTKAVLDKKAPVSMEEGKGVHPYDANRGNKVVGGETQPMREGKWGQAKEVAVPDWSSTGVRKRDDEDEDDDDKSEIAEWLDSVGEAAQAGDASALAGMFSDKTWPDEWDDDIDEMLYEGDDDRLEAMRKVIRAVRDSDEADLDETFFRAILGSDEIQEADVAGSGAAEAATDGNAIPQPSGPPNLREARAGDMRCATCEYFGSGKCLSHGSHPVSPDQVCDDWEAGTDVTEASIRGVGRSGLRSLRNIDVGLPDLGDRKVVRPIYRLPDGTFAPKGMGAILRPGEEVSIDGKRGRVAADGKTIEVPGEAAKKVAPESVGMPSPETDRQIEKDAKRAVGSGMNSPELDKEIEKDARLAVGRSARGMDSPDPYPKSADEFRALRDRYIEARDKANDRYGYDHDLTRGFNAVIKDLDERAKKAESGMDSPDISMGDAMEALAMSVGRDGKIRANGKVFTKSPYISGGQAVRLVWRSDDGDILSDARMGELLVSDEDSRILDIGAPPPGMDSPADSLPDEEVALAARIIDGVSNVNSFINEQDADAWDALRDEKGEDYIDALRDAAYARSEWWGMDSPETDREVASPSGGMDSPPRSVTPPWAPEKGWKRIPVGGDDKGNLASFALGGRGGRILSYNKEKDGWSYDGPLTEAEAEAILGRGEWTEKDSNGTPVFNGPNGEQLVGYDEGWRATEVPLSDAQARDIAERKSQNTAFTGMDSPETTGKVLAPNGEEHSYSVEQLDPDGTRKITFRDGSGKELGYAVTGPNADTQTYLDEYTELGFGTAGGGMDSPTIADPDGFRMGVREVARAEREIELLRMETGDTVTDSTGTSWQKVAKPEKERGYTWLAIDGPERTQRRGRVEVVRGATSRELAARMSGSMDSPEDADVEFYDELRQRESELATEIADLRAYLRSGIDAASQRRGELELRDLEAERRDLDRRLDAVERSEGMASPEITLNASPGDRVRLRPEARELAKSMDMDFGGDDGEAIVLTSADANGMVGIQRVSDGKVYEVRANSLMTPQGFAIGAGRGRGGASMASPETDAEIERDAKIAVGGGMRSPEEPFDASAAANPGSEGWEVADRKLDEAIDYLNSGYDGLSSAEDMVRNARSAQRDMGEAIELDGWPQEGLSLSELRDQLVASRDGIVRRRVSKGREDDIGALSSLNFAIEDIDAAEESLRYGITALRDPVMGEKFADTSEVDTVADDIEAVLNGEPPSNSTGNLIEDIKRLSSEARSIVDPRGGMDSPDVSDAEIEKDARVAVGGGMRSPGEGVWRKPRVADAEGWALDPENDFYLPVRVERPTGLAPGSDLSQGALNAWYRVTAPGQRPKYFFGESAWSDAERYASDQQIKASRESGGGMWSPETDAEIERDAKIAVGGGMRSPGEGYTPEQIAYGKRMAQLKAVLGVQDLFGPELVGAVASEKDAIEWLDANPVEAAAVLKVDAPGMDSPTVTDAEALAMAVGFGGEVMANGRVYTKIGGSTPEAGLPLGYWQAEDGSILRDSDIGQLLLDDDSSKVLDAGALPGMDSPNFRAPLGMDSPPSDEDIERDARIAVGQRIRGMDSPELDAEIERDARIAVGQSIRGVDSPEINGVAADLKRGDRLPEGEITYVTNRMTADRLTGTMKDEIEVRLDNGESQVFDREAPVTYQRPGMDSPEIQSWNAPDDKRVIWKPDSPDSQWEVEGSDGSITSVGAEDAKRLLSPDQRARLETYERARSGNRAEMKGVRPATLRNNRGAASPGVDEGTEEWPFDYTVGGPNDPPRLIWEAERDLNSIRGTRFQVLNGLEDAEKRGKTDLAQRLRDELAELDADEAATQKQLDDAEAKMAIENEWVRSKQPPQPSVLRRLRTAVGMASPATDEELETLQRPLDRPLVGPERSRLVTRLKGLHSRLYGSPLRSDATAAEIVKEDAERTELRREYVAIRERLNSDALLAGSGMESPYDMRSEVADALGVDPGEIDLPRGLKVPQDAPDAAELRTMNIASLAGLIESDWGSVNFAARPYLDAMYGLDNLDSPYGAETGRDIVPYFLSNARSWTGPVARAVKAELKARLAGEQGGMDSPIMDTLERAVGAINQWRENLPELDPAFDEALIAGVTPDLAMIRGMNGQDLSTGSIGSRRRPDSLGWSVAGVESAESVTAPSRYLDQIPEGNMFTAIQHVGPEYGRDGFPNGAMVVFVNPYSPTTPRRRHWMFVPDEDGETVIADSPEELVAEMGLSPEQASEIVLSGAPPIDADTRPSARLAPLFAPAEDRTPMRSLRRTGSLEMATPEDKDYIRAALVKAIEANDTDVVWAAELLDEMDRNGLSLRAARSQASTRENLTAAIQRHGADDWRKGFLTDNLAAEPRRAGMNSPEEYENHRRLRIIKRKDGYYLESRAADEAPSDKHRTEDGPFDAVSGAKAAALDFDPNEFVLSVPNLDFMLGMGSPDDSRILGIGETVEIDGEQWTKVFAPSPTAFRWWDSPESAPPYYWRAESGEIKSRLGHGMDSPGLEAAARQRVSTMSRDELTRYISAAVGINPADLEAESNDTMREYLIRGIPLAFSPDTFGVDPLANLNREFDRLDARAMNSPDDLRREEELDQQIADLRRRVPEGWPKGGRWSRAELELSDLEDEREELQWRRGMRSPEVTDAEREAYAGVGEPSDLEVTSMTDNDLRAMAAAGSEVGQAELDRRAANMMRMDDIALKRTVAADGPTAESAQAELDRRAAKRSRMEPSKMNRKQLIDALGITPEQARDLSMDELRSRVEAKRAQ